MTIPDSGDLETQQVTVSAWFAAASTPGNYKYLVAKGSNDCATASYGLYDRGERRPRRSTSPTARATASLSPTSRPRRVRTASGTTPRARSTARPSGCSIDGKAVGTGQPRTSRSAYGTPAGNATIGAYGGTCDLALIGDLDEVSIWQKALPVADIWRKASIFCAPH